MNEFHCEIMKPGKGHALLAFMDIGLLKNSFACRGFQEDSSTPRGGIYIYIYIKHTLYVKAHKSSLYMHGGSTGQIGLK